ncbi:MAG: hypothetical protein GY729_08950, partial [Desulfobacteraceae bacterium]|nr:hypothetical protein [Desulfobacteraceae bacterium]
VLRLLSHSIALARDYKLISFFSMIKKYPDLIQLSELLDTFLKMVSKVPAKELKIQEIDSLVFFKTIEMIGFPGKPGVEIYNSLKGIKNKETKDLKFFHLENLVGHKMELGELKHVIFGDSQDVFQYETFYTLFEFIEGITWEMSFNFNPLECVIRR